MNIHSLLRREYQNWGELESQIENISSDKEKGDVFEDFVHLYFELNKNYYQIQDHWRYRDAPIELKTDLNMEKNDKGADGLIRFKNGKIASYQAKFRTGRVRPSYEELTKLWAESRECDYQYTVANCYGLTNLAKKNPKHLQVLCDEFDRLDKDFFNKMKNLASEIKISRVFYDPDPFQREMIQSVLKEFVVSDRGKLIAACGTGKTLTSLWIAESLGVSIVLYVAPSIALIKQTLMSWSDQSKSDFDYLCICSDESVIDGVVDESDLSSDEIGIPVSTNEIEILKNLKIERDRNLYIFSTYQSLGMLSEASKKLGLKFDLGIFDEAHRTSGSSNNRHFSIGLTNKKIDISKRLFMTATERLLTPRVIKKAEQLDRIVFSMDDEEIYGKTIYRYSFGDAIKEGAISDYKVIISAMSDKEIFQWIEENNLIIDEDDDESKFNNAQNIFKQILLIKSFKNFSIKKCITFHNTVLQAKEFINGYGSGTFSLRYAFEKLWEGYSTNEVNLDHINGDMSSSDRHQKLSSFAQSPIGVISNARCLTEGVDVPLIDSVYFVTPRNSLIDIVQACGRALRKPRGTESKTAYFIVPILIPDGSTVEDALNSEDFQMVHQVIQALRDQDIRLEQWIDQINLRVSKGRPVNDLPDPPVIMSLPQEFSVKQFELKLYTRIAEVNGEPTQYLQKEQSRESPSRKSGIKRVFRTLGDYTFKSYIENLVNPTLRFFATSVETVQYKELKINNNNVSHTERLGLIEKNSQSDSLYQLTALGKFFVSHANTTRRFDALFRRQMLTFFVPVGDSSFVFPYRGMIKLLCELGSLNYFDYIFCIYTLQSTSKDALNTAKNKIQSLRSNYPKIGSLNKMNKLKVLKDLNQEFQVDLKEMDVWTKRTTTYNQWGYMKNHLLLFSDFIFFDKHQDSLKVNQEKLHILKEIIKKTEPTEAELTLENLYVRYRSPRVKYVKYEMS